MPMPQTPETKMRRTKVPRNVEEAYQRLHWDITYLNRHSLIGTDIREQFPLEWHTLEADLNVAEKKEKVTLYLDRSVARCFRGMGKGYQARINQLLRTWMLMKIAREIEIDEALNERRRLTGAELEALLDAQEEEDRKVKKTRE